MYHISPVLRFMIIKFVQATFSVRDIGWRWQSIREIIAEERCENVAQKSGGEIKF